MIKKEVNIETNLADLPRMNVSYALRLKNMGLQKVRDLLFYFPTRYEDFSSIKNIKDLKIGEITTISGTIQSVRNLRTFRYRTLTQAIIEQGGFFLRLVWFGQPYLIKILKPGEKINASGKVSGDKNGILMYHPSFEIISGKSSLSQTGRIVPVYPETKGVSSKWIRKKVNSLFYLAKNIPETLPQKTIKEYHLPKIDVAIQNIHFPSNSKSCEAAQKRFAFEKMLEIQLRILKDRQNLEKEKSKALKIHLNEVKKFIQKLPFALTQDQKRIVWEILQNTSKGAPMNRLIEGDVGSGKTIVAAIVAFNTALEKKQVALMAPTEILARQHFESFIKLFSRENISLALLTSSEKIAIDLGNKDPEIYSHTLKAINTKDEGLKKPHQLTNEQDCVYKKGVGIYKIIKEGKIDIVIGTHALIQEGLEFQDLALAIIDEQHRFGIKQRKALRVKSGLGKIPHLLSLSATPIPRTLAIAFYGDLDISQLREMPLGRKKIITKIILPKDRQKAYEFLREKLKENQQAFVICPRIELGGQENLKNTGVFSERPILRQVLTQQKLNLGSEIKAVKEEFENLSKNIFPEFKCAMLHGKMKPDEKNKIMQDFKSNKIQVLISTSIVEVGMDVPNATLMIIESAERFGLAQLHQIRGRVGRSEKQSFCFVFTNSIDKEALDRLEALVKSHSGFELAEYDLKLRGPGQFIGEKQSGLPDFAMSSLANLKMVNAAKKTAEEMLAQDPELKNYPQFREKMDSVSVSLD
jgi:ATP-dependent DNA helicase RecG